MNSPKKTPDRLKVARNLDAIMSDKFEIPDLEAKESVLALLSLRIALKAYFSTYKAIKRRIDFPPPYLKIGGANPQMTLSDHEAYCEACSETILHLHHFVELVMKDFLRNTHPLLAIRVADMDADILLKLSRNEAISSDEYRTLKWVEFYSALERICKLSRTNFARDERFSLVSEARGRLEKLNGLRNGLWHQGVTFLNYSALDELVGGIVLPFVMKALSFPEYDGLIDRWKYRPLHCGIDPLQEIITTFSAAQYNIGKIALLKELGRAAYNNPIIPGKYGQYLSHQYRLRAEQNAAGEAREGSRGASSVKVCPVCGISSLLVYTEFDVSYSESDPEEITEVVEYPTSVECLCCTFKVNTALGNPNDYDRRLDNFWQL